MSRLVPPNGINYRTSPCFGILLSNQPFTKFLSSSSGSLLQISPPCLTTDLLLVGQSRTSTFLHPRPNSLLRSISQHPRILLSGPGSSLEPSTTATTTFFGVPRSSLATWALTRILTTRQPIARAALHWQRATLGRQTLHQVSTDIAVNSSYSSHKIVYINPLTSHSV
jgi:hypothetical protein